MTRNITCHANDRQINNRNGRAVPIFVILKTFAFFTVLRNYDYRFSHLENSIGLMETLLSYRDTERVREMKR